MGVLFYLIVLYYYYCIVLQIVLHDQHIYVVLLNDAVALLIKSTMYWNIEVSAYELDNQCLWFGILLTICTLILNFHCISFFNFYSKTDGHCIVEHGGWPVLFPYLSLLFLCASFKLMWSNILCNNRSLKLRMLPLVFTYCSLHLSCRSWPWPGRPFVHVPRDGFCHI